MEAVNDIKKRIDGMTKREFIHNFWHTPFYFHHCTHGHFLYKHKMSTYDIFIDFTPTEIQLSRQTYPNKLYVSSFKFPLRMDFEVEVYIK